jgi:hypothetical protein
MSGILINNEELTALKGLNYLQRCLYLEAIRPYMDYKTGIVGIKRGISLQSIKEELFIEPRSGVKEKSASYQQIRRAIFQLEKKGLIKQIPRSFQLIFECPLALKDKSVQNKAGRFPAYKPDTKADRVKNIKLQQKYTPTTPKEDKAGSYAGMQQFEEANIPPVSGILDINNKLLISNAHLDSKQIYEEFERIWTIHPIKKSKKLAFEKFKRKKLYLHTEKIISYINLSKENDRKWISGFVPYLVTIFNQERWNDEIETEAVNDYAKNRKNSSPIFTILRSRIEQECNNEGMGDRERFATKEIYSE